MDSFKLERLSEDIFTHSSSVVDGGLDDASLTNANAQFTCSVDSGDDGSMLVARTMKLSMRRFPYVFRSESDVDILLTTRKSADLEPKQNTLRDTRVTTHSVLEQQNNASDDLGGLLVEIDSDDSGSLESVSSDEESDLESYVTTEAPLSQSIGHKRKQPTPSAHPFSTFGNHALLQYHFKNGVPPSSTSQKPRTNLPRRRKKANFAPPRKKGRQLVLETQEEKDAYIMMRVARWQTAGKGLKSGWSDLARQMNTSTLAVRKRWEELSQCELVTEGHKQDAKIEAFYLINTSKENIPLASNRTLPITTTSVADTQYPTVSYILACIHGQSWLLRQRDDLHVIGRQLGVELGKKVEWFDQLWWQKLRYLYVQKYGYPRIGKTREVVVLSNKKSAWLSDCVRAWKGRGRGLWENLGSALGYSGLEMMQYWSCWTPLLTQNKCVEDACIDGSGSSQSTSTANRDSNDSSINSTVSASQNSEGRTSLMHNEVYSQAVVRRISQLVYAYYTDTSVTHTVETFWKQASEQLNSNPHTLTAYWKQACINSHDADLYIPLLPVPVVRCFTPFQDAKITEILHAMLRRWGKIDWPVVAHALSASEYVLRARWYCFIRPTEFRLYAQDQSKSDNVYMANGSTESTTIDGTTFSTVCNVTEPGLRSLVFDMVNTVSITARLDATTLNTIHHNTYNALAGRIIVQRTIAMEKMVALSDVYIANIIASVVAWNAGTSTATSLTELWENIASKLVHKWPGKSLFAWWIKLCTMNRKSQLIVVPVVVPITPAYLVFKFSQLFSAQIDPTDELMQFLQDTPLAKDRWCELLSHRPGQVYTLLQAQKKSEENESLPRNQVVDECVKEIISALELTERMDGYLASHTIESRQTQQIRENAVTQSAVAVVLRGIVSTVVKKSYAESVLVLKICNKYKRSVSSWLHSSQLPTVKRRPSLNVVRKALLLCVRYATKTATKVNWLVLASLLHRAEDELGVLWAKVQRTVCTLRDGRWYLLKSLDEQLDLL